MNTSWNARIKLARELRGLSKANFARLLDVSPSTVTEWESGNTKSLTDENLVRVCGVLRVRGEWLVRGTLPMEATIIHDEWSLSENLVNKSGTVIPLPLPKPPAREEKPVPAMNARLANAFELASPVAQNAMADLCKALVFASDEDIPGISKMILDAVLDRPKETGVALRPDQLEILALYEAATPAGRLFAANAFKMPGNTTNGELLSKEN